MSPLLALTFVVTGCALVVTTIALLPELADLRTNSLHPDLPPKGPPVHDAIVTAVVILVGVMFLALAQVYVAPPDDPDLDHDPPPPTLEDFQNEARRVWPEHPLPTRED